MSPKQGWFESDDDYRSRVAQEANERTIENSAGSAPTQGWFESDEGYRERIAQEANECRIEDSTDSAPSQGWLESDETYRDRIAREANERVVEDATGSSPSQGFFESDSDYDVRVRREASEHTIRSGGASAPRQGFLEGDHNYRSRIAHEAREIRARSRPDGSVAGSSGSSSSYSGSEDRYSSSGALSDASGSSATFITAIIVIVGVIAAVAFSTKLRENYASDPQMITPAPSSDPATFGPGVPDFETRALASVTPHYGPGSEFDTVGFEIEPGEKTWVETVKNGWCMINSAEWMWVNCAALAPPVGGWKDVPGPLPPRGD